MAFLAPLFLIGLAAITLPVILHLRKNRPKQTVAFSSLMFLEPSPLVTKRRARIQDVLLLVLRCLALALLALAFARPYFPAPQKPVAATGGAILNFLLIDNSASMRGAPLEKALAVAEGIVDGAQEEDWIAVGTFSGKFRPLVGADRARELATSERKSAAKSALDSVTSTWESTALDSALLAAVASVEEGIPVKIHLIGDFQKDQAFERLASEVWPSSMQVIPHPVTPGDQWTNAGLHIPSRGDDTLTIRVANSEGSANSKFSLKWSGIATPQQISVPPGESAVFDAPQGIADEGEVSLSGDNFSFDNKATWAARVRPLVKIWYPDEIDASDSKESLYFLTRAVTSTPDYEVEIVSAFPQPPPAIAISAGAPGEAATAALRDFIEKGGTGLFTLDSLGSVTTLANILGKKAPDASASTATGQARFGEIDFKSTVFAPFADARYSDFSGIRIWNYQILPPELTGSGTVIAHFDTGDPAWVVFSLGRGTLHVLTTTWRPADSQLALTTKFPPLLHALLNRAAVSEGSSQPLFVGDPLPVSSETSAVVLPNGEALPVGAYKTAEAPGIYRAGGSAFSVQLDPTESELTPIPVSRLAALGLPTDDLGDPTALAANSQRLSGIEQERQQKWAWWLVIAAAAFFVAETLFAAISGKRPAPVRP